MFDWLESLPATLRLAVTLLVIVLLMRGKIPMGLALLVGGTLLAVFFGMPWAAVGAAVLEGLFSQQSVFLLIIVITILVFSGTLGATGQIERIIDRFRTIVGESRLTLVTFPALIGLLPMPGGAMFSAPMVEHAAARANLSPERTTIANYWFRHIWEYWFPIYPGVILALTLADAPTGPFILMQLPMTLCSLIIGYVFILRGIHMGEKRKRDYSRQALAAFIRELTPILIVVVAVALLDPLAAIVTRALQTDSILLRRLPVLLGLIFGGAWLFLRRGLTWRVVGALTLKRNTMEMAFLALGVTLFQAILKHSGAVVVLRDEFTAWHVPLLLVICLLPFVAGLVVGLVFGLIGCSFPVVVMLLSTMPVEERLPYYCLAFSFGYVGMMLSPVHLCLVLTNEYFKASLLRVYRHLIPLNLATAACSVVLFLLYRML
jgi:hypothetical protein